MNCRDIRETFANYRDLKDDDMTKSAVDHHVLECESCSQQYHAWLVSLTLIQTVREMNEEQLHAVPSVKERVMTKIYEEQAWNKPLRRVEERISLLFRQRVLTGLALSFLLVLGCFVASLMGVVSAHEAEQVVSFGEATAGLDYRTIATQSVDYGMFAPMIVGSSVLLIALLLALSWYMRLRD